MNPKEKAKEIMSYFREMECSYEIKKCSLILVNEIINCDIFFKTLQDLKPFSDYWNKVQEEITKL